MGVQLEGLSIPSRFGPCARTHLRKKSSTENELTSKPYEAGLPTWRMKELSPREGTAACSHQAYKWWSLGPGSRPRLCPPGSLRPHLSRAAMSAPAEQEKAMIQHFPGQDKGLSQSHREGSQESDTPVSSACFLPSLVGPQFPFLSRDTGDVKSYKVLFGGQGGIRKSVRGFREGPELLNSQAYFWGKCPGFWLLKAILNSQTGKNPLSRIIFHFRFNPGWGF